MQEINPNVFVLSNGLRVVYLKAQSYVAHLGLTILAGSRFEDPDQEGLAHFLEHCIFKGTTKRKAYHVLNRLDSVGGELNAYTSKEEMCVYASFTKNHFKRSVELLADIVCNSTFPTKEINKEKEIILDEINSYLDSPSDKIFDDFEELFFKGDALGNNILGTKKSVSGFTGKDLQKYIEKYFVAERMVISFVGDVPQKQVQQVLESYFSNVKSSIEEILKGNVKLNAPFKIRSKEANYQVHAVIGAAAPSYLDDKRRVMTLLTNILGGPSLNSRLLLSVREKYGFAYNIEANYNPFVDTGFWNIYFGTEEKNLEKSLKLTYKEISKIQNIRLGNMQLSSAKEQLKGQLALGLDSNNGLMLGLGKSLLLFNQIDTVQEIYNSIDNVSATEIMDVANEFMNPDDISELIFTTKD